MVRNVVAMVRNKRAFGMGWAAGWLVAGVVVWSGVAGAGPSRLELRQGDRICLVGNALAERMQHDGWLEALAQRRFPTRELVFRNLGFSGDELTVRQRTAGFGDASEWLTRLKASVVFAFFGFNESFAGEAGLAQFRKDLEAFIQATVREKYDGNRGVRLVLFSPTALEDLGNADLPPTDGRNREVERYSQVMAEVATGAGVLFVDLFEASKRLYAQSEAVLTINGLHLNAEGNRQVAAGVDSALFGPPADPIDWAALETLRQAILDKNSHWFQRYRTTDGYNVYGGRSELRYVDNVSNREVLQREMEVLDAMAANRDRRIWALAQGGELEVDDRSTPAFMEVKSNKPGPGPEGQHTFLSGEEAIAKMKLAEGLQVNLVASEERFPELVNPVQMAFDPQGRLWVAAWPTYPHWQPKSPLNDKLLILEDEDGDGRADRCRTFVGDLHNPTGFEFYGGGVLVAMAPDLLFLKDTDGDGRADWRQRILHGISSADTHHTANSFVLDPGGALYFQEGVFHQSQIETVRGPQRNHDACVWRFEPRTWKVERFIPYGFANPHGHVFDYWGQDFVHDGTGSDPYHGTLFSGHLDFPQKHGRPPLLYDKRTRPCPGTELLSSSHFPEATRGNLLVANVIGFLGILQYRLEEDGASFKGVEVEPIVQSSDANFRPSDIEVGPDGAIYFTDWHNPIIGHMQHHLRDPSRDKQHGRVYRVTHRDRPLVAPAPIAGQPIATLLDRLKERDDRVRYRARIELGGRPTGEVMRALRVWMENGDKADPAYEHHGMEALWLHQSHNVVNEELLRRMLRSPEPRARAAATRVLCCWRDRVSDALGLLKAQAEDDHPRVRLEAVRACSFFSGPEAADVALLVLEKPIDPYLQYTLDETMKQLDRFLR